MLTLLPYPNFQKTAEVMTAETLFQQIVEINNILNVLHQVTDDASSLENDPGVLIWKNDEVQLAALGLILCLELNFRGTPKFLVQMEAQGLEDQLQHHLDCAATGGFGMTRPKWLGNSELHLSHQSELIRQDCQYKDLFPGVPDDIQIFWPRVMD